MSKRIRCVCGVRVGAGRQHYHEQGAWHKHFDLIKQSLEINMTVAQIARLISRKPSYVSHYLKIYRNGA